MDELQIEQLLDRLDGSGSDSEWAAVRELRKTIGHDLPTHLFLRFKTARKFGTRSACVYHATRYARENQDAIEIGKAAIYDKSRIVRYRGCLLLAYSLRKDLLQYLREASTRVPEDSRADVLAAIDAIEHQNHNYFEDRDHSGQVTLNIM